ncbi:MAG: GNAT family N-acyltransferase [Pseudomonadota bacterium]
MTIKQTDAARGQVLGRIGTLEVRLVGTRAELGAAQELRFQVFYEEMSAGEASGFLPRNGRDIDRFDAICDHLIVIDYGAQNSAGSLTSSGAVVGTYRLLRQSVAEKNGGFYSQDEYDIDTLIARHPGRNFLELGRSCVLPAYRTKRTVELLWHGIWSYTLMHGVDVMFGCASLGGTDPTTLTRELAFLSRVATPPEKWSVAAHSERYVAMIDGAKGESHTEAAFSNRKALAALPPLIKGYLRLGAYVGDGAVVDFEFGTTDVLIILPVENINPRYISYYGENAGRHAA